MFDLSDGAHTKMRSDLLRPPPDFRGPFITREAGIEAYGTASGILRALPAAAAVPADAEDVRSLVRWAAATRTPLVPRGAGTGMPGGNIGPDVAVDLVTSFRGIEPPDPERRTVRVEAGVTLAELNSVCRAAGLHLPVDPSSGNHCTIGGMIANNSAGAHSVKYGAMRPWVESLDIVLPDGSRTEVTRGVRPDSERLREILSVIDSSVESAAETIEAVWPRVRKNSSGYALLEYLRTGDAVDLIVGSEGTLAIVVAAEIRLAPVPPERGVALLEFASLEIASETIIDILPLGPATCEMLDRTFIEMIRQGGAETPVPLSPDVEAVLLVEIEGDSIGEVNEGLERVRAAAGGATRVSLALDPRRQHEFWEIRHAASPIIAARADGRRSMQFIEDGVVPVDRLPDYVRLLRQVLDDHDLPAVIFGHAGDGNLHVNPLVDVASPGWRDTLESVLQEVATGIARLGGTLAGEHGDGRLRAPLLETIWGTQMTELFRSVKHAFDPGAILNPGVIIPLPGQGALDALPAPD